jgi:hypothetical protein
MAGENKQGSYSALGTNWGLNSGPFRDITGTLAPNSSGMPITDPYQNAAVKMEGFADQFNKQGVDDSSRLMQNLTNNSGIGIGSSPMRTSMNALNKDRQRDYFDTMSKVSSEAFQEQMANRKQGLEERRFEFQKRQQLFDEAYKMKQMSDEQYRHAVATNFQAMGVDLDKRKFAMALRKSQQQDRQGAMKLVLEAIGKDAEIAYKAAVLRKNEKQWADTREFQDRVMNKEWKAGEMQSIFGILGTILETVAGFSGGKK